MSYTSYFSGNATASKAQPNTSGGNSGINGKGGYTSFFGFNVQQSKPLPKSNKVQPQPQAKVTPPKSPSMVSKIGNALKNIGSSAITGERQLATGIARDLPGGTADLQAQQQQAESAAKNVQYIKSLQKSGKINPVAASKIIQANANSASGASKQEAATIKAMPSKKQIGLGAASTAADILTAGALPEVKTGATLLKVGSKGKAIATEAKLMAANAVAGGLNAASGGGDKSTVIKNAATGALLPEALHVVGTAGANTLVKATEHPKVQAAINKLELPKAALGKDEKVNGLIDRQRMSSLADKSGQTATKEVPTATEVAPAPAVTEPVPVPVKTTEPIVTEPLVRPEVKTSAKVDTALVKQQIETIKNDTASYDKSGNITIEAGKQINMLNKQLNAAGERVPKTEKPVTVTPIETPMVKTPEIKQSKLAASTEQKAIDKKLTQGFEGKPEYAKINTADQAKAAIALHKSDPERAVRIALGQETPPEHLLPESVYTAVENHALKHNDVDLLRNLATNSSLSSEATGMGQRIRMLGEREPDSAVVAMRKVADARKKAVEAQLKKSGSSVSKAIQKDVTIAKQTVKRAIPDITKSDWNAFIESVRC